MGVMVVKGLQGTNDGKFSLLAGANNVLQFSYIGYIMQEQALKGTTPVRIVLKEDSELLDEVVVIGYGTVRKSCLLYTSSFV